MSKMQPDLDAHFRQFVPARGDVLMELEQEAERERIPIVGPVVGELLYILARATGSRLILELGTATGYSAVYLARACKAAGGRVVTLERNQDMAQRASANLHRAGVKELVEIRVGDAINLMKKIDESFDFIFLDIDKGDYLPVLSQCERLLKKGGLLVTDNVGFQASSDFNRAIFSSPKWRCVHLLSLLPLHSPERDGLCIALRL